ncbi:hypothetical protein J421_6363 (plasmid) [Gemmatirosa kalamazoonensis]|uniref:General secretion pathway GspH domain-containing protein n=1 Tax=Gemmatirosa kalamazoonensis TaxID=861299 RepID=W0RWE5_9BACT|nr:prepilin-type N-terminal cleavage/methylation domain-containing protein [Gemmatirosa kalamazoonensis]AHG93898.1 hypothetical protein J421_6363 [Gemmatirosa kalamazoonensis]
MVHITDSVTRRRSPFARSGFSLTELLIALVMASILATMAGSPLARARNAFAVRAVRQTITAVLDAARAGAVQRGRTGRFVVRGNAVLAYVDTVAIAGGSVVGTYTVMAPEDFLTAYGAKLSLASPGDTLVAYDGRGFANPRLGRIARVIITKGTAKDSVCITNLGQVMPRGCSL